MSLRASCRIIHTMLLMWLNVHNSASQKSPQGLEISGSMTNHPFTSLDLFQFAFQCLGADKTRNVATCVCGGGVTCRWHSWRSGDWGGHTPGGNTSGVWEGVGSPLGASTLLRAFISKAARWNTKHQIWCIMFRETARILACSAWLQSLSAIIEDLRCSTPTHLDGCGHPQCTEDHCFNPCDWQCVPICDLWCERSSIMRRLFQLLGKIGSGIQLHNAMQFREKIFFKRKFKKKTIDNKSNVFQDEKKVEWEKASINFNVIASFNFKDIFCIGWKCIPVFWEHLFIARCPRRQVSSLFMTVASNKHSLPFCRIRQTLLCSAIAQKRIYI